MDLWSKFADWLKENPWWGALGFLVGLLGIIIAIILFMIGRHTKEPIYAIQSTNLIQDFTGRFDSLEITYARERISNLTATKVAFWNNGKATINSGDIASADPLMIRVKNGYKILDPDVLHPKKEYNPNQFSIKPSEDGSHVLIQFDYLDKGQGGVIQLLHTGEPSDDVEVCGTVKGAGKPNFCLSPISISALSQFERLFFVVMFFILPVGVVFGSFNIKLFNIPILMKVVSNAILLVIIWGCVFYIFKRRVPKGFEIFEKEI